MRSFRAMKYQILAVAALLLSGPYITAAADPADQAQWSESVPSATLLGSVVRASV